MNPASRTSAGAWLGRAVLACAVLLGQVIHSAHAVPARDTSPLRYRIVTADSSPLTQRIKADLANAVRQAHEGKLYFLPHIAERLANLSVRGDASPQSQLDERGLEIFKLMAEGLTNAEIAEKLNLSTKTISNISQAVKEKLGVHRQAYITKLAVKHGLIEP